MTETTPKRARKPRKKNNVVSFDGGPLPLPRVVPEIVDCLRALLAEAEGGKLVTLAFIAADARESWKSGWVGDMRVSQLAGLVSRLHHDLLAAWARNDQ